MRYPVPYRAHLYRNQFRSPTRALGERVFERVQPIFGEAKRELHVLAVARRGNGHLELLQHSSDGLFLGVVDLDARFSKGRVGDDLETFHHPARGGGVRTHEAAGAELRAAEVAYDHQQNVADVFVLQDVQDGPARRPRGFSVIVRTHV